MLRIAICDDDIYFAAKLEEMVLQEAARISESIETEVYSDGSLLVIDTQKGYRYELIFFDIEMKNMDGIKAAHCIRKMNKNVLFIYVSAHEQYLQELFEVEPFRFLSKPINVVRFQRYFREAYERISNEDAYYQFVFKKEIRKVNVRDIVYFESRNRIVYIFMENGDEEHFYGKLNDVERKLLENHQCFLRIHQSYLVNYNYIKKMNYSNITLWVEDKEIILRISEDREKAIRAQLCRIAGEKVAVK